MESPRVPGGAESMAALFRLEATSLFVGNSSSAFRMLARMLNADDSMPPVSLGEWKAKGLELAVSFGVVRVENITFTEEFSGDG